MKMKIRKRGEQERKCFKIFFKTIFKFGKKYGRTPSYIRIKSF